MMFTHATLRYFSGQDYDDEVYSGLPKKAVLVDDEDPINIPLELVARVLHDFHKELYYVDSDGFHKFSSEVQYMQY